MENPGKLEEEEKRVCLKNDLSVFLNNGTSPTYGVVVDLKVEINGQQKRVQATLILLAPLTGATGIEPAISGLTGRRVNHYTTPPKQQRPIIADRPFPVNIFSAQLSHSTTPPPQQSPRPASTAVPM